MAHHNARDEYWPRPSEHSKGNRASRHDSRHSWDKPKKDKKGHKSRPAEDFPPQDYGASQALNQEANKPGQPDHTETPVQSDQVNQETQFDPTTYYHEECYLGSGSYGEVWAVTDLHGRRFARKQLLKSKVSWHKVEKELNNIVRSSHTHVVTVVCCYEDKDSFNIIMSPCAEGDLTGYLDAMVEIQDPTVFGVKRKQLLQWMYCLAATVHHIHNLPEPVRHRDIKPDNILYDGTTVYLTDFGLAFASKRSTGEANKGDVTGTLYYRGREVSDPVHIGRKDDIFALGCVFFEMARALSWMVIKEGSEFPMVPGEGFLKGMKDKRFRKALCAVQEDESKRSKLGQNQFPPEFLGSLGELIFRMLNTPGNRPDAGQVVHWIRDILDVSGIEVPDCC